MKMKLELLYRLWILELHLIKPLKNSIRKIILKNIINLKLVSIFSAFIFSFLMPHWMAKFSMLISTHMMEKDSNFYQNCILLESMVEILLTIDSTMKISSTVCLNKAIYLRLHLKLYWVHSSTENRPFIELSIQP